MQVEARAKINLALDVVERMDNGYHSLDMHLFQFLMKLMLKKMKLMKLSVKV